MKGGYLYTVLFMLVLSLVLASGLALAHAGYQPQIQRNQDLAEKKALLEVFGLDVPADPATAESLFAARIRPADGSGPRTYYLMENGAVSGAAIPFSGPGLWGTIRGYLAVSADKSTLLGLVFTEQNETPGLGGRIGEAAFRDQFRGLAADPGKPLVFGAADSGGLDAVSGATSSSRAVLQIVNRLIADELPGLEIEP
jgi:Na+-transporting NADH:ubiquinone oxidoreductase subunit C